MMFELFGQSVTDWMSRLATAAVGGLLVVLASQVMGPPEFQANRLEILEPQPVPAGCPVTAVLAYSQRDPAVVTLGLFFARRGRQTAVPQGMYDLPAGQHVIGFYVMVPPWLPPGDYKVYLLRTGIGWFGRPTATRIESERLQIGPPGVCPEAPF
jgi:hypothetical protein